MSRWVGVLRVRVHRPRFRLTTDRLIFISETVELLNSEHGWVIGARRMHDHWGSSYGRYGTFDGQRAVRWLNFERGRRDRLLIVGHCVLNLRRPGAALCDRDG